MKVLVIYELIPEETKRAVVEMTVEEYQYFKKAHNVMVNNSEDEEGINVVNVIDNAFCDKPEYAEYCDTEQPKQAEYFGKWTSDLENTDISEAEALICCGYIL